MAWYDPPVPVEQGTFVSHLGTYGNVGDMFWDPNNPGRRVVIVAPSLVPIAQPSAPPNPRVPPHAQFSVNTVGTPICLAWGNVRLAGQPIWVTEIVANVDEFSYVSLCNCYCEPIDPTEPVRIQKMWADGTLFYDYAAGGVLTVPILSSFDQAELAASVATMEFSLGGVTQQPSTIMQEILGAGEVPAYRNLRTIVFADFPLAISNNAIPNISVEFRRTDDVLLVDVSEALERAIGTALKRRGYDTDVSVEGIDDLCSGLIVSAQGAILDFVTRHRDVYNYQILDGDPIRIVRREINASLVLDYEVNESDLVRRDGSPTIQMPRTRPETIPVSLSLAYSDVDRNFDMKSEQADHEGTSVSTQLASLTSEFVIDSTTAKQLSYAILYQQRAKALTMAFEMDDITPQVGDVVAITTTENDLYICLIQDQTHTKQRSSVIKALNLLTAQGLDVDGDPGAGGGSTNRRNWPEEILEWDFIVTTDRIYSIKDYEIGMTTDASAPSRRLSGLRFKDLEAADPTGQNWGGDFFFSGTGGPSRMFEDDFYVYWMHNTTATFTRLAKTATSMSGTLEHLVIPEGFYVDGDIDHDNFNITGDVSHFRDGKLYIAWYGRWDGDASDGLQLLVVVDIEAWDVSAFNVYAWDTASFYTPTGIAVTDNGSVVIATKNSAQTAGRYYYSSIGSLGSWSNTASTFPMLYNSFASSGDAAYFGEAASGGGLGTTNRKSRVAVVDMSAGISESVVDLATQDADFDSLAQFTSPNMWASGDHLFVYGNHSRGTVTTAEHRYIGRFDLGSLADADGKFLRDILYNENDFYVRSGRYFDGRVYLSLSAFNKARNGFFWVNADLDPLSGNMWPKPLRTLPVNDDFSSSRPIVINVAQANDLTYASTEIDEPVPDYAIGSDIELYNNGHSVWYRFIAPATGDFSIAVANAGPSINEPTFGIAVYTGSDLSSLTYIDGVGAAGGTGPSGITFSATSGTTYRIAVRLDNEDDDNFGGALTLTNYEGKFTIEVSGVSGGGGGGGGGGYDNPETFALYGAISPDPGATWLDAVDALITTLKDEGIWDTFDLFYDLGAPNQDACLTNWVDVAVGALTVNGSVTFSADEYAASDGSTGWLSSSYAANSGNAVDGDSCFGYFCLGENSSDAISPFQVSGGKHSLGIQSSSSGASIASVVAKLNTSTSASFSSLYGSTVGHWVAQQNNWTAQLQVFLDGASLGTSNQTHSVDTGTVQIFKTGAGVFCGADRKTRFVHYGSALTSAQQLILSQALYTFLTAQDVRPMAGGLGGSTGPTNVAPYKRVAVGTGNSLSMPVCMTPSGQISGLLQCHAAAYGYNAIRVNDPNYLNLWRFEIHDGDNAPFDGGTIDRVQVTTLSNAPIDMGDTVDVSYSFFIESGSTNSFSFCDLINLHAQSEVGQNPFAHALQITTGKFYSWVYDSGTTTETDSTLVTIAQGTWHHVRTTLRTGVSGMAQTWLNGTQILNYTGTVGGNESDPFWFNIALYRGGNVDGNPAAVWYANIEIDTSGTQPYAGRVASPLAVPPLT